MAIISGARTEKKEKLKIEISAEIYEQIKKYCEWSGIENLSFFIEEAAGFVFTKDKEWKEHQKAVKRARKKKSTEAA